MRRFRATGVPYQIGWSESMRAIFAASLWFAGSAFGVTALADDHAESADKRFTAERVFDIEYATDPQISPDGETIVMSAARWIS